MRAVKSGIGASVTRDERLSLNRAGFALPVPLERGCAVGQIFLGEKSK